MIAFIKARHLEAYYDVQHNDRFWYTIVITLAHLEYSVGIPVETMMNQYLRFSFPTCRRAGIPCCK
jgi:hypothetical protein